MVSHHTECVPILRAGPPRSTHATERQTPQRVVVLHAAFLFFVRRCCCVCSRLARDAQRLLFDWCYPCCDVGAASTAALFFTRLAVFWCRPPPTRRSTSSPAQHQQQNPAQNDDPRHGNVRRACLVCVCLRALCVCLVCVCLCVFVSLCV